MKKLLKIILSIIIVILIAGVGCSCSTQNQEDKTESEKLMDEMEKVYGVGSPDDIVIREDVTEQEKQEANELKKYVEIVNLVKRKYVNTFQNGCCILEINNIFHDTLNRVVFDIKVACISSNGELGYVNETLYVNKTDSPVSDLDSLLKVLRDETIEFRRYQTGVVVYEENLNILFDNVIQNDIYVQRMNKEGFILELDHISTNEYKESMAVNCPYSYWIQARIVNERLEFSQMVLLNYNSYQYTKDMNYEEWLEYAKNPNSKIQEMENHYLNQTNIDWESLKARFVSYQNSKN